MNSLFPRLTQIWGILELFIARYLILKFEGGFGEFLLKSPEKTQVYLEACFLGIGLDQTFGKPGF